MAHHKAADSKREQFRQYLEKSGVLDMLTKVRRGGRQKSSPGELGAAWPGNGVRGARRGGARRERAAGAGTGPAPHAPRAGAAAGVLVALYEEPEKPDSALDFLKHHLGASAPENPEIEALRLEVAEMKEKYEAVLEENKKLKTKLAQYEPPQDEKHGE